MPYPRLTDDGRQVTLDLHGARVDEAVDLVRRVVQAAARRGRGQVKLIHGSSTTSRLYRNRTIKHALHDLLENGSLDRYVIDTWQTDDVLVLSLDVTALPDPTPLHLPDLLH